MRIITNWNGPREFIHSKVPSTPIKIPTTVSITPDTAINIVIIIEPIIFSIPLLKKGATFRSPFITIKKVAQMAKTIISFSNVKGESLFMPKAIRIGSSIWLGMLISFFRIFSAPSSMPLPIESSPESSWEEFADIIDKDRMNKEDINANIIASFFML